MSALPALMNIVYLCFVYIDGLPQDCGNQLLMQWSYHSLRISIPYTRIQITAGRIKIISMWNFLGISWLYLCLSTRWMELAQYCGNSIAKHSTVVTPLLTPWSSCSIALSPGYGILCVLMLGLGCYCVVSASLLVLGVCGRPQEIGKRLMSPRI